MTNNHLLEARGIAKSFGGVKALKEIYLTIRAGEIHAIVGENGAGKSTLTKILAGVLQPDAGNIAMSGHIIRINSPAEARHIGISVVHQELELADSLSIAENLFLGKLPNRGGLFDRQGLLRRSRAALDLVGLDRDPTTLIRQLSIPERQLVEIAKSVIEDAKIIFLDEPTAALSPIEAENVHKRIRLLRDRGVAIVYISHHLEDVLAVSDRISVLRDGSKVAELVPEQTSRTLLIEHILGHEPATFSKRGKAVAGEIVVSCRKLSIPSQLNSISFDVRRGEIVGFFGLLGAGQSAIAEALFGLRADAKGQVHIAGSLHLPRSPSDAIALGLGYVPPDRKTQGLALGMSVKDNLLTTCLGSVSRLGFVRKSRVASLIRDVVRRCDIRCTGPNQRTGDLSGGNQQKVVLGKWRAKDAPIMLFDQPTRGVDVGAKSEIYLLLREHASAGGSSLVISSDAEEITATCDRAFVLRKGVIASELAGPELSVINLLRAALLKDEKC